MSPEKAIEQVRALGTTGYQPDDAP